MKFNPELDKAFCDACDRLGAEVYEVTIFLRNGRPWVRFGNRTTPLRQSRELYGRYNVALPLKFEAAEAV